MWDGWKWEKESRRKLWPEASVGFEQGLGGVGSRTQGDVQERFSRTRGLRLRKQVRELWVWAKVSYGMADLDGDAQSAPFTL